MTVALNPRPSAMPPQGSAEASTGAPVLTLAGVAPRDRVRVTAVRPSNDPIYQRLLNLGVIRGRELEVVRRAPAGDPIEVRLMGCALSLRRNEADLVEVELLR